MRLPPDSTLSIIADALGQPIVVEHALESLSNAAWLVRVGDKHAVLRLHEALYPAPVIDHSREIRIHQLAASEGLSPPIMFADVQAGILLTEFVAQGALTEADMQRDSVLASVGRQLAILHAMPTPVDLPSCSLSEAARVYLQDASVATTRQMQKLVELVERNEALSEREQVLCHRDVLFSNILATEPVQFIDWEFASLGERWFDLAAAIAWHTLGEDKVEVLLQAYLDREPNACERAALARAIASFNALCILWSQKST